MLICNQELCKGGFIQSILVFFVPFVVNIWLKDSLWLRGR